MDCYLQQGKIDLGLATCNELLSAVSAIRQGKEQTETSSTFWRMILEKRGELIASELPDLEKDVVISPPSHDLGPAMFDSGLHATSTGTQVVVKTAVEDLWLRGSSISK